MGNDMVNDRCRHKPSISFALHAQGVLAEICFAYPLPLTAVTTLGCGWSVWMQRLVLCTV